jgi:hypothetical protein
MAISFKIQVKNVMKITSRPKNMNLLFAFWSQGSEDFLYESFPFSDQPADNVRPSQTPSAGSCLRRAETGTILSHSKKHYKIYFVSGPAARCFWLPGPVPQGNNISRDQNITK